MASGALLLSTGHERVDRFLQTTISRFATAFPGRVCAFYIEGSYANGTSLATSDLDLTIVFREHFADEAERASATALAHECAALSPVEFDAEIVDEATLSGGTSPQFKLGSRLLSGEEIRAKIPLMPLEVWTRHRMHAAYRLMVTAFHRPPVVRLPLGFPDPTDPWGGYASRKIRLPDGTEAPSTRNLIRTTGWAATALIALKARQYVVTKRDCHLLYRAVINDEWAALFEDIYHVCRENWQYLIPARHEDQQRLRAICERALAFENHFLGIYKHFLLAQLRAADEAARQEALQAVGAVVYADRQIISVIQCEIPTQMQELARQTLQRIQEVLRLDQRNHVT